jgi:hypothetical protein
MELYYVAGNSELMATSPKYRFFHEAKEAAKHLNERYPTRRGWHAVSSQPPMTPEQCCGWMKDRKIEAACTEPRPPPQGAFPPPADDDDLYC